MQGSELVEQVILIVHVLTALAIIGLILLQQGKGAEMGASFGSGGSQTLFGSAGGGNVLTRATAILAALFFITSLGLAYVAKQKAGQPADAIEVPVLEESRGVAPVPADEFPQLDDGAGDLPAAAEDIPAAPEQ